MSRMNRDGVRGIYLALRGGLLRLAVWARPMADFQPSAIKTVLVLRHDRIGDMVLSTGYFRALKEKFPRARLIVVASEMNAFVVRHDPGVDEVWIYRGWREFRAAAARARVDLAIDLFYTYEMKTALLTWLSGARYRLGFVEAGREIFFNLRGAPLIPKVSMIEQQSRLVKSLGIDDARPPQLHVTEEERNSSRQFLAGRGLGHKRWLIGIHPGGYYASQRWPMERFVRLARELAVRADTEIVFFRPPASGGNEIVRTCDELSHHVAVTGELSVRQLMALIQCCSVFVCNNSGPMHIASAFGIPTVSTLGPTDAVLWKPWGSGHIVVEAPGEDVKAISLEKMRQAVETKIAELSKAHE